MGRLGVAIALVAVGLSACSNNTRSKVVLGREALPAVPADSALLVIYRTNWGMGDGPSQPTIEVNSQPTCDARSGGAFTWVVSPGNVTVSAAQPLVIGTSRLSLTAEAGKTYYIRVRTSDKAWAGVFGGLVGALIVEAASERKGAYDIDLTDEATAFASDMKMETCGK
jgi:hypothetical protein